jgi:hypothetical protein
LLAKEILMKHKYEMLSDIPSEAGVCRFRANAIQSGVEAAALLVNKRL